MKVAQARIPIVFAVLLLAQAASSQAPDAPTTGDTDAARRWANEAKSRFQAGDYSGTIEAIAEAEKHFQAPTLTKLSAQAHDKLGKPLDARRLYMSIRQLKLDQKAPASWIKAQEDATVQLAALAERIPNLHLTVDAPKTVKVIVAIDDKPLDPALLDKSIPMDPGDHEIKVTVDGTNILARRVSLKDGMNEFTSITLTRPQASGPWVSSVTRSDEPRSRPFVVAGYVSLGVGAAGLVLGAVAGGLALSGRDEVRAACGAADFDAGRCESNKTGALGSAQAMARASTAGFVFAGVGAAAGAALLVLAEGKRPATVSVGPGFVTLRGTF